MHRALLIALAVIAAVVAIAFARGMSAGTNIDERQKHWEKEISAGLNAGATREELQAFASRHGQALNCYQNHRKEDQCDFDDKLSLGGSRNLPMRLAVIFVIRDGRVASHQFATTPAGSSEPPGR